MVSTNLIIRVYCLRLYYCRIVYNRNKHHTSWCLCISAIKNYFNSMNFVKLVYFKILKRVIKYGKSSTIIVLIELV